MGPALNRTRLSIPGRGKFTSLGIEVEAENRRVRLFTSEYLSPLPPVARISACANGSSPSTTVNPSGTMLTIKLGPPFSELISFKTYIKLKQKT
jgi:hypothetical protein